MPRRILHNLPHRLLFGCLIASSSYAASYTSSFYVGGHLGGGNDRWHSWVGSQNPDPTPPTQNITQVKHNNTVSYGGVVGYRFNQTYAAELNYFSMPDNELDLAPGAPQQTHITHHYFDLVGHIGVPIFNSLLYGQFGIGYGIQTQDRPGDGTQQQTMPVLGLGDSYQFNPHVGLGVSYTHFMSLARKNSQHYLPSGNFLTMDLKIYFGSKDESPPTA